MKKRIVLALGGNALGENLEQQMIAVHKTGKSIVSLVKAGYELIITHGNGPQVGLVSDAFDFYRRSHNISHFTMSVCVSLTQGFIGYDLQNAIREELISAGVKKHVSTLITQVIVDKDDPAFKNPTKPIGPFFTKEEAEKMTAEGHTMISDAGRGYRRAVPSPKPVKIVEDGTIRLLVEHGEIVIACGGGGIPVVKEGNHLKGMEAVIDKDFASAKLAHALKADAFVILTAVERAAIGFNTPDQQWLSEITVKKAREYADEGQFGEGSMKPKILAACEFIEKNPEKTALITHLDLVMEGLAGKAGTRIVP